MLYLTNSLKRHNKLVMTDSALLAILNSGPGARFSKVPKLFVCFSSDITLLISSKQRLFEKRNFPGIEIFIPFPTYENTSFTE